MNQYSLIKWIKFSEKKPSESNPYLYCLNGVVEVHWFEPVDDRWSEGNSGNMDYPQPNPYLWAKMPKARREQI